MYALALNAAAAEILGLGHHRHCHPHRHQPHPHPHPAPIPRLNTLPLDVSGPDNRRLGRQYRFHCGNTVGGWPAAAVAASWAQPLIFRYTT